MLRVDEKDTKTTGVFIVNFERISHFALAF